MLTSILFYYSTLRYLKCFKALSKPIFRYTKYYLSLIRRKKKSHKNENVIIGENDVYVQKHSKVHQTSISGKKSSSSEIFLSYSSEKL